MDRQTPRHGISFFGVSLVVFKGGDLQLYDWIFSKKLNKKTTSNTVKLVQQTCQINQMERRAKLLWALSITYYENCARRKLNT